MSNKNLRSKLFIVTMAILPLFVSTNSFAQGIKIGQQLPDSIYKNIYNYPEKQFRFSDFKTKLILLDFWSPACSGCIAAFPKLDSLQKTFKNEIQIILVNKESLDSTKHLFQKRKYLYKPNLPFITSDKYFNKTLSIYALPVEAWIYQGKYYGLTEGTPTSNEIRNFLSGKDTVRLERGRVGRYINDIFDPEFRETVGYYSYISHAVSRVGFTNRGSANACILETGSIKYLYTTAFDSDGKMKFSKPGRTIIETNDSTRFFRPVDDNLHADWDKKYVFHYSLSLPDRRVNQRYTYMQQDLSRYFNIKATIEKRIVKCLVLVRTSNIDKIKTHGGMANTTFMGTTSRGPIYGAKRGMINEPYDFFSIVLGANVEHDCKVPFIDATGYSGNVDIQFNADVVERGNLALWRQALAPYDLDLIQKECLLDVLVLNDKK